MTLPDTLRRYEAELAVLSAPSRGHQADLEAAWLMLELQAGCMAALSDLHRRFSAQLKRGAARILHDPDEVEDVLQEVFSMLPAAAARFDAASGSVGGLLWSIMRNLAVSRLRRSVRMVVIGPDDMVGLGQPAGGDWPPDGVGEDLNELIVELPLFQRQVLWLRYWLDLPFSEIAIVLGRLPASVRQAHRRALVQLARTA